jgi:putative FmdB family regulatory protein
MPSSYCLQRSRFLPNYLYQCDCGQSVTVNHSMNEVKIPECLKCLKAMKRVFTFQDVRFKGSGFYSTDSKATED